MIPSVMELHSHQNHVEKKDLGEQEQLPDLENPRGTLSVRRNPPRRAKHTPASRLHKSSGSSQPSATSAADGCLLSFSIDDHVEAESTARPRTLPKPSETSAESSENLKVFLRIRPLEVKAIPGGKPCKGSGKARANGAAPSGVGKSRRGEKQAACCLLVNDARSVTLTPPPSSVDSKRGKSEVFDGFSFVFPPESQQNDVYQRVLEPLVVDFLQGKSGLLAAMGPTGSGKTYTMFGSPQEPGIVHLALERIFCHENVTVDPHKLRSYYLSMFEIYSDRGKGERIFDLSSGVADPSVQESTIRNPQEVMISNIAEADCVIARGMLKRMTAVTNANCQSSRSQCVINIRCEPKVAHDGGEVSNCSVLTILDLAGAERERRTGNQGARLLESNFINNTSMVFSLCLRSLLDHQKNPKRTLQKHFQNSLLTRCLRDYMEGKKRMTLILTVKPGEDDYSDSSFLLRQASPYMRIKFNNVEDPHNAPRQKRCNLPLANLEHPKRRKYIEGSLPFPVDGTRRGKVGCPTSEKESPPSEVSSHVPEPSSTISMMALVDKFERMKRNNQVLQTFSKALWNVLKQYKKKLEVSENDAENFRRKLREEEARSIEMMKQLQDLKSRHYSCCSHILHPVTSHSKLEVESELCISSSPSKLGAEDEPEIFASSHVNELSEVVYKEKGMTNSSPKVILTDDDFPGTGDLLLDPITSSPPSHASMRDDDHILASPVGLTLSRVAEKPFSEATISVVEGVGCPGSCEAIKFPKKENRVSSPKILNLQKPRRRLLPASVMLLKELNGFDMEIENPKATNCSEGSEVTEQRGRSQGPSKLLRLLRSNLQ